MLQRNISSQSTFAMLFVNKVDKMIIRRYKNYTKRKEAVVIQGDKIFIVEEYQLGEFKHIKDYKSFQKAQKEALKYIEE